MVSAEGVVLRLRRVGLLARECCGGGGVAALISRTCCGVDGMRMRMGVGGCFYYRGYGKRWLAARLLGFGGGLRGGGSRS